MSGTPALTPPTVSAYVAEKEPVGQQWTATFEGFCSFYFSATTAIVLDLRGKSKDLVEWKEQSPGLNTDTLQVNTGQKRS